MANGKDAIVALVLVTTGLFRIQRAGDGINAGAGCWVHTVGRNTVGALNAEAGGGGAHAKLAVGASRIGLFPWTTGFARLQA